MSFCTECGARLGAAARFCAECGAALAAIPPPHVEEVAAAPFGANGIEPRAAGGKAVPPAEAATIWDELTLARTLQSNNELGEGEQSPPPATGAGTPRATIRPSELSSAQITAASTDALLVLAVVFVVLMVGVALAAGIFAPQGHHGSPADWLRTAVVILGLGMHSPAELHVAVAAGQGAATNATVVVGATFTPLIVSALVGFGCFWFARRTESRAGSSHLKAAATASILTGAVFAGALALLTLLTSGLPGFGLSGALGLSDSSTSVTLGINPWYLLPTAFVLAGASTFLGRAIALARTRGVPMSHLATTQVSPWLVDLRTAKNLILGAAAVTALALVCIFGWSGIHALFTSGPGSAAPTSLPQVSDADTKTVIGALLGGALLLPNLVVTGVGSALGGTLGVSGSGSARSSLLGSAPQIADLSNGIGLFSGGVPTMAYLILLPMTLMALALGVRAAMQRAPGEVVGPHVWRTSTLFAGVWVLLAFLVRISVNFSGSAAAFSQSGGAQGSAAIGLGLPSILIAAVLWGTIAALGGALIARFSAAALPRPVSLLGGSDLNPEWKLLLADAVMVRGGKMPLRLADAAENLRSGTRPQSPPLIVHPERDRLLAVGAMSLVVLILAGTVGYRVVQDNVYGPNEVVKAYYAAVESHDAPGALRLLDASTSQHLDKGLLTSAAMRTVPSNVSIGSTTYNGDHATVKVNQTLTGTATETAFTLTREGSVAGIFDSWRLNSPFTQLTIATNNDAASNSLTVNGVAAAAGTHPVFPAEYTVAQAKVGLFQGTDSQINATGEGTEAATLNGVLDPSVQNAADQAVSKMLNACADSADAAPIDCPFSYDDSASNGDTLTNVHWSITGSPTVNADVSSDGTISLTTTSEGTAHLSALSIDSVGTATPVSQDPTITVSGTLNWDGADPSTATMTTN